MCLALNMAKQSKGGISRAAMKEKQYPMKRPHADVREQIKLGVYFLGYINVKATMERDRAMLHQNHTLGCHQCQNATPKNLQTHWRHTLTGAPLPNQPRYQTPEPTLNPKPPLPGMPPTSTANMSRHQCPEIANLPVRYAYSDTSLPSADLSTLETSDQDSEHDMDYDPHMLPDEATSTG